MSGPELLMLMVRVESIAMLTGEKLLAYGMSNADHTMQGCYHIRRPIACNAFNYGYRLSISEVIRRHRRLVVQTKVMKY